MKEMHEKKKAEKAAQAQNNDQEKVQAPVSNLSGEQQQVHTPEPESDGNHRGDYWYIWVTPAPDNWGKDVFAQYLKLGYVFTGQERSSQREMKILKSKRDEIETAQWEKDRIQRQGGATANIPGVRTETRMDQVAKTVGDMLNEYPDDSPDTEDY